MTLSEVLKWDMQNFTSCVKGVSLRTSYHLRSLSPSVL